MPATLRHPIPLRTFTERLTLQTQEAAPVPVLELHREGSRAVGTTARPHDLATGDYCTVFGASPEAYNFTNDQIVVTDPVTFSYALPDDTIATPATGAIAIVFLTDAQGGDGDQWFEVGEVWASIEALSATERLAAEGIGSTVAYRAVVHYRPDLSAAMRALWRRYRETRARTLQIAGVFPHPDEPRRYLVLECGEIT